jgi:hypothetical protein
VFSAVQGTVSAAQILALVIGGLLLFVLAPRTIILAGGAASAVALALTIGPVVRSAGAPAHVEPPGTDPSPTAALGADAVAT